MFKRKGGGSKAFWTMLKKTALFLHDGFPKTTCPVPSPAHWKRSSRWCSSRWSAPPCPGGATSAPVSLQTFTGTTALAKFSTGLCASTLPSRQVSSELFYFACFASFPFLPTEAKTPDSPSKGGRWPVGGPWPPVVDLNSARPSLVIASPLYPAPYPSMLR